MPPGAWYHVIWNTLGSWLPGDPRGFRNRDHRIHSSGDYRNPPPREEHANLLAYNKSRSRDTVTLPRSIRPAIIESILDSLQRAEQHAAAISVAAEHVHVLAALPHDYEAAERLVGKLKTYASLAVRVALPGSIWSRGCTIKRVSDESHWEAKRHYLTFKQERGACTWDVDVGVRWQQ